MFQWINGHGFVTLQQAATWMDASYYAARRRLRVLVDNGYLERKRFEHGGARVHWLTTKGWEVSGDSLAPRRIGLMGQPPSEQGSTPRSNHQTQ